MNRVAVVILNYKGIQDTIACLSSFEKQSFKNFTIIAVENNSNDSSKEEFKKLETKYGNKLHTIYNATNRGFAGGVNSGIRWALKHDFEYIALFNNDAIADKNWLKALLEAREETNAGITTGLLLHETGETIDSTGDWYSTWGLPYPRNRGEKTVTKPEAGFVFSGSGGASLYSVAMLREIGLFDETFFAYYEDMDISFRAQLSGWKVAYTPRAIAYHKQGATSSKMPGFGVYQTFKNLPLVYIKNVPKEFLFQIGLRFFIAYLLILGHAIKKGNGKPAIRGLLKGCMLFWTSALPARRRIQKSKKVSTEYIRSILWNDLPPNQTGLRKLRKIITGRA
jgi:GT2 family glycosyltransferase